MNKLFGKIMFCTSLGFAITAVCLSVQSCSSDSDDSLEAKPQKEEIYEYLECSEDDIFSKRGMEVLSEAFQRIGDKLVVESDTCYLTVHAAKDFNMSDYLFSMVKQSVGNANMQYKMYLLFKDNDKGIIIKNPFEINKSTIRTRLGIESAYGNQWSTTTYTLSNADVIIIVNSMRSAGGDAAQFAGLIALKYPGVGTAAAMISLYSYFNDRQFSEIQDKYARSGSTNGITLIESTMYSPTGMSSTVYGANINK